jgi:pimeloyl-ACP methyl ester carboxylesterase
MRRGQWDFDVVVDEPAGADPPAGADTVVLLHGFPQRSSSWDAVVPLLTGTGLRCVRMDQRGYSPGARPRGRSAYRLSELVDDAVALIQDTGAGRPVHLVGHDWGAAVAWATAAARPDLLRSLTALSVPHPAAFRRALLTSRQVLASWYMLAFQPPWLAERLLAARRDGTPSPRLVRALVGQGQRPELAERDASAMDSATLTGALAWYRALPLSGGLRVRPVTVPTMMVWSDGDRAITGYAARGSRRYCRGPYRFEELAGVSHWIPDEAPAELAGLLVDHLRPAPDATPAT